MAKLQFFSLRNFTAEHRKELLRSLKQRMGFKIVDYHGNYLEMVKMEQPIKVYQEDKLHLIDEVRNLPLGPIDDYKSFFSKELLQHIYSHDQYAYNYSFKQWQHYRERVENDELTKADIVDQMVLEMRERGYAESDIDEKELGRIANDLIASVYPKSAEALFRLKMKTIFDNARRSKNKIKSTIWANLDRLETFVTLTFAVEGNEDKYREYGHIFPRRKDDMTIFEYVDRYDFEAVKKAFTDFIKRLKKAMKKWDCELYYVATWERHVDGAYHFHALFSYIPDELLMAVPSWLDYDYKVETYNGGRMFSQWIHGKSDVQQIKDKERASTYVAKYMSKNAQNLEEEYGDMDTADESMKIRFESAYEQFKGSKKMFTSQNLRKPEVEYLTEIEKEKFAVQKERAVETFAEVHTARYKNYYNDSLVTKNIFSKRKNSY